MSLEKELCRVVDHLGATDPVTATDLRRFASKMSELLFPADKPKEEPAAKSAVKKAVKNPGNK